MEFPTGRYDIARALEKWGGLREVSRLLSLKVRQRSRQQDTLAKDHTIDHIASPDDVDSEINTPSKPCIYQDTQKWIAKLKHLDINWFL